MFSGDRRTGGGGFYLSAVVIELRQPLCLLFAFLGQSESQTDLYQKVMNPASLDTKYSKIKNKIYRVL